MTSEDPTDEESEAGTESGTGTESSEGTDGTDVRERLEESRDRAVEGFDEGVIDLLSWVLETNTRARIYVDLRQHPDSTSDEIAEGTGLYPSTVREALAELHEEGVVERDKRESDGAGNNPYEYRAIAPSALVRGAVEDIQASLNDVFQLDRYMGGEDTSEEEPVTISVEGEDNSDEEWGDPGEDEAAEDSDDDESESYEGDAHEESEADDGADEDDSSDDDDSANGDDDTSDEEQDEDIDESL
jgi:predicted transcriptional regulator